MLEKRLLQLIVAFACIVPLAAGGAGAVRGPGPLWHMPASPVFNSHYHYLSGLLLGIGIGFLTCLPSIENKGARFRTLGFVVLIGGLARLWAASGADGRAAGILFPLAMELGVVPLLMLWQAHVARRMRAASFN